MSQFAPEKQFVSSQAEYMTTSALPNAVKYSQLMPRATSGRGSMRRFQSSNGTVFNPTTNNIIRIDVTGDKYSFLDSVHGFLEIQIQNTGGGVGTQVDSGCWAIIDTLRIESNTGIELERINNYNLLHTKLFQYQTPPSHLPISNATSGTVNSLSNTRRAGDLVVPCGNQYLNTQNGTIGAAATLSLRAGSAIFVGAGDNITLTMPLISGFLANNNSKYIPLGSSSGFTIELTLATAATALVQDGGAAGANAYTVQSISYNAPIVYITGNEFQTNWVNLLNSTGGVAWSGTTYANHVTATTGATGAGAQSYPINERCRSLNSIFTIIRTTANTTNQAVPSLSRSQMGTAGAAYAYQYRVGDLLLPPSTVGYTPIASGDPATVANLIVYSGQNMAKAYSEVLKALGMLHSTSSGNLVNLSQYANVEATQGLGMFGIDLEAYLSDSGISESGIDTASNAMQVSFEPTCATAAASRMDHFCMKTAIYHLSSDGSFSVSQ